jgi:hypothetical protein
MITTEIQTIKPGGAFKDAAFKTGFEIVDF